jgi:DNA-binding protein H-NS
MSTTFITHARTAHELQAELCSDLRRRIEQLAAQRDRIAKSAAEKARIAARINELADVLDYWSKVEIQNKRKG